MENRLIKVAKRLASLWKASRQLRVGLLLFLGVLLVAILAGVLSPYDPYYLSDDLLVPPGSEKIGINIPQVRTLIPPRMRTAAKAAGGRGCAAAAGRSCRPVPG